MNSNNIKMTTCDCEEKQWWCGPCYKHYHTAYKEDTDKLYKMKKDTATTREEWDKMTAYMTEKYAKWNGWIAPPKRWVDKRFNQNQIQ